MNALIRLHNWIFDRLDGLSPVIMPTLARLIFAGVLLRYFWSSAATKLSGPFTLDTGAFVQIFPKKFEAVGYNADALSSLDWAIVYAGTYAEFILPFLILIGLFTRISAIGMIVFVVVQSIVDVVGHHADAATIGKWFDVPSGSLILDQRAFWMFLLLYLVFKGAGPLSVDRFIFDKPRGTQDDHFA